MRHSEADTIPELPELDSGVQLLEAPDRAIGPLHTLVLDTVLRSGHRSAVWVDAHNYGTSQYLARVSPTPRVLDRIRIARAFTPYQHQSLIDAAATEVDDDTALLVIPAVDALYRTDDVRGAEPQSMLLQTLSKLARYARSANVPVLLTQESEDDFSAPIVQLADGRISVEQTEFGLRFQGSEFETLVYADGHNTVQTTLAYWERILAAREPVHQHAHGPERTVSTA
ncbi:MAG: hypothetical protein ABEJ27_06145 [Halodesulfurarchaeum sp.]